MTSQPRMPAGTRDGDVPVAGRYAHKTVPGINNEPLGFNNTPPVTGPPNDWDQRVVKVWGAQTTFTRTVGTNTDGAEVVTFTTDCDPPDVLLLARKGDGRYWVDGWKNNKDRRIWAADIAVNMLNEGFVATSGKNGVDGLLTAMRAAAGVAHNSAGRGPHVLTGVVAQIRGLRLMQSMAPADGWGTTLGGFVVPSQVHSLLDRRFVGVSLTYHALFQPPWDDPDVPWGPQTVAGHATNRHGATVFVGEHNDLLWRALTETTVEGISPLKARLFGNMELSDHDNDLVIAAALYDPTAEKQLTTGLVDGVVDERDRYELRLRVRTIFDQTLKPDALFSRWTGQQQHRLRSFVDVIDGLEP